MNNLPEGAPVLQHSRDGAANLTKVVAGELNMPVSQVTPGIAHPVVTEDLKPHLQAIADSEGTMEQLEVRPEIENPSEIEETFKNISDPMHKKRTVPGIRFINAHLERFRKMGKGANLGPPQEDRKAA